MSLPSQPVSATNVINFQRSTNVFGDVVEQIYLFIETSQDYTKRIYHELHYLVFN